MTGRFIVTATATMLVAGVLAACHARGSSEGLASFLCGAIAAALGVAVGSGMLGLTSRWKGILPRIISSAISGVLGCVVGFFAGGLELVRLWLAIIGNRFAGDISEAAEKSFYFIPTIALLAAVAGLLFGAGLGRSLRDSADSESNATGNP